MDNEIWAVVCHAHKAEPTYVGPFVSQQQADDWAVEQGRGGGRRVYQVVCLLTPWRARLGSIRSARVDGGERARSHIDR
jgi:hypothetical protein